MADEKMSLKAKSRTTDFGSAGSRRLLRAGSRIRGRLCLRVHRLAAAAVSHRGRRLGRISGVLVRRDFSGDCHSISVTVSILVSRCCRGYRRIRLAAVRFPRADAHRSHAHAQDGYEDPCQQSFPFSSLFHISLYLLPDRENV